VTLLPFNGRAVFSANNPSKGGAVSLRLEMLQAAQRAPGILDKAREPVAAFLEAQFHEDGGARDRAGNSDLYYTVFLLESLLALDRVPPVDRVQPYLERFGDGEGLDLVHLTCLARCWAALPDTDPGPDTVRRLRERIESHRCADGGFGTVYHGFLALGALQDLGGEPADTTGLEQSITALLLEDGAFASRQGVPAGTTPTTAAAITVLCQLGAPVPLASTQWLLARAGPEGGFRAAEGAPIPDLLSTSTALHALACAGISFAHLKESTLDLIDSLWTGRAFCGTWADDTEDCEYTFHALLSLGHLSLA